MSKRVLEAFASVAFFLAASSVSAQSPDPLLQRMAGTWNVDQKMWPSGGSKAVQLPPAVAERSLLEGKYIEEAMRPVDIQPGQPEYFVRNALLNYNAVESRYEYYSIDTRAPQVMSERGGRAGADAEHPPLKLAGGTFTAPEWGPAKNVRFKYRLEVGAVEDDTQFVRLYLTPQSKLPRIEFLAFEYKYVRQK